MKKQKIKYVLIDFGGTFFTHGTSIALDRFEKTLKISKNKTKPIFHLAPGSMRKAYSLGTISAKNFWDEIKIEIRINQATVKKMENIWHSSFVPNKGMIGLVKKLKKKYKIFVISGNIPERIKFLKRKYPLNELFDGFFFSFNFGVTKPNPDFFQIAIKKLKIKPQKCLVIDDSKEFIGEVKKLGGNGIIYKNTKQTLKELRRISNPLSSIS
jgi:putative hydrolase of the HAD superfamily